MNNQEYEKIKKLMDSIYINLYEAEGAYRLYCHILKLRSTARRLEVYKEMYFLFHFLQNSLLYDFILKITKIMDNKQQRENYNTTFGYLNDIFLPLANKNETNSINQIYQYLTINIEKLKKIRNKQIAHLDRDITREEIFRKYSDKRKNIRKYLNKQLELIKIYRTILIRETNKKYIQQFRFESRLDKDIIFLFETLFSRLKDINKKKVNKDSKYNFNAYVNFIEKNYL